MECSEQNLTKMIKEQQQDYTKKNKEIKHLSKLEFLRLMMENDGVKRPQPDEVNDD